MGEIISAQQLRLAAKGKVNESNMNSVLVALDQFGARLEMDKPHILAQFFPQVMHESGDFKYDGEIWGPTKAQQRYDTRTDLGNTPEADGDGFLYRGRTGMQLTGKSNYRQFRDWCRQQGFNPPDFVAKPDLVNTDPWEGLVPLWYWHSRNLNKWANEGDIETVTKKINGGKNGLADRMDRYGRVALIMLGYGPTNVRQFQADHIDLVGGPDGVDGDVGPKTRAALHTALVGLTPGEMSKPEVKVAPVTEEKVVVEEKPVVPAKVEKEVRQKTNWLSGIFGTLFGAGGVSAWLAGMDKDSLVLVAGIGGTVIIVMLIGGEWIIRRVRSIKKAVEE